MIAYLAPTVADLELVRAGWFRSPSTTVREWRSALTGGAWELWDPQDADCDSVLSWFQAHHPDLVRERRMVVSPPAQCIPHPCPDGIGKPRHHRGSIAGKWWDCERCGGSGVVAEPLLIGVEQWRQGIGEWRGDWHLPPVVMEFPRVERRQALLVRVTLTGGPIPVVHQGDLDATPTPCISFEGIGYPVLYTDAGDDALCGEDGPSLRGKVAPGDQLWRCEVEHLAEPITDTAAEEVQSTGNCWPGFTVVERRVPLSLPLGEFVSLEVEQP